MLAMSAQSSLAVEIRPSFWALPVVSFAFFLPLLWTIYLNVSSSPRLIVVLGAAALASLGVVSALVGHELAHSLAARLFGWPTTAVTLSLFGAAVTVEAPGETTSDAPALPRTVIAAAGPLFNLVTGLGLHVLADLVPPSPLSVALTIAASVSLVLAVANVIPISPLDGHQAATAGYLWPHLTTALLWLAAFFGFAALFHSHLAAAAVLAVASLHARLVRSRIPAGTDLDPVALSQAASTRP